MLTLTDGWLLRLDLGVDTSLTPTKTTEQLMTRVEKLSPETYGEEYYLSYYRNQARDYLGTLVPQVSGW